MSNKKHNENKFILYLKSNKFISAILISPLMTVLNFLIVYYTLEFFSKNQEGKIILSLIAILYTIYIGIYLLFIPFIGESWYKKSNHKICIITFFAIICLLEAFFLPYISNNGTNNLFNMINKNPGFSLVILMIISFFVSSVLVHIISQIISYITNGKTSKRDKEMKEKIEIIKLIMFLFLSTIATILSIIWTIMEISGVNN